MEETGMTGKDIIKVQLDDDIRRTSIHNDSITYDDFILMMQRVFRGKLGANDEITLKYKDEDGDLITIFDSSDLLTAVQSSRILKVQIFRNKPEEEKEPPVINLQKLKQLKGQLQSMRDDINRILDLLSAESEKITQNQSGESVDKASNTTVVNPSEFDPLEQKNEESGPKSADHSKMRGGGSFPPQPQNPNAYGSPYTSSAPTSTPYSFPTSTNGVAPMKPQQQYPGAPPTFGGYGNQTQVYPSQPSNIPPMPQMMQPQPNPASNAYPPNPTPPTASQNYSMNYPGMPPTSNSGSYPNASGTRSILPPPTTRPPSNLPPLSYPGGSNVSQDRGAYGPPPAVLNPAAPGAMDSANNPYAKGPASFNYSYRNQQ